MFELILTIVLYGIAAIMAVAAILFALSAILKFIAFCPFLLCLLASLFMLGLPVYLAIQFSYWFFLSIIICWPVAYKIFDLIEKYNLDDIMFDD